MAQQTFRSAFNGFNREDVVSYIEYLKNNNLIFELSELPNGWVYENGKLYVTVKRSAINKVLKENNFENVYSFYLEDYFPFLVFLKL